MRGVLLDAAGHRQSPAASASNTPFRTPRAPWRHAYHRHSVPRVAQLSRRVPRQRRRGAQSSSSGIECWGRPDDLDAEAAYRRGERLALGDRRRACAREHRHAEVREQPLKAAGDRNRQ